MGTTAQEGLFGASRRLLQRKMKMPDLKKEVRLAMKLSGMADDLFLVWSLEHCSWWKPSKWGYTEDVDEAGHFTKTQVTTILHNANGYGEVKEVAIPLCCVFK